MEAPTWLMALSLKTDSAARACRYNRVREKMHTLALGTAAEKKSLAYSIQLISLQLHMFLVLIIERIYNAYTRVNGCILNL
jgi:hypothetical protein